jgi:cobalt-zinc-cadmium efflux system membrane fusion protein
MKKHFLILLLFPFIVYAHGGDDHAGEKQSSVTSNKYFSSIAVSEKYELLLKYSEIEPNEKGKYKLFISNYTTNQPIDSAKLLITVLGKPNLKINTIQVEKGIYEFELVLPDTIHYSLNVQVDGVLGPDLIQLKDIHIGESLNEANTTKLEEEGLLHHAKPFLLGVVITLLFIGLYTLLKKKKITSTQLIIFFVLVTLPISTSKVSAHGGDDHGDASSGSNNLSNAFIVEKESQFLFELYTKKLEQGGFNSVSDFFGTIIPANNGRAVVQSPQVSKVISIKVNIGQRVQQGQILAVVEQQIDAATQISWQSEKNTLETEFIAAKKQYDRLKSIEDIAAKKDVLEAEVRYQRALKNKNLFEKNNQVNTGSARINYLRAPIAGTISPFNLSVGSIVNPSETLFEILDSKNILIEAQIFGMDYQELLTAQNITVSAINSNDLNEYKVILVSKSEKVNSQNQSKQFFFSFINNNQPFVNGQNVKLKIYSNQVSREIVLSNSAIVDVNGKPAVFIKDDAEEISISFITKGQDNGKYSVIKSGAEEGEKIIINNVFQLKNIYLNQ